MHRASSIGSVGAGATGGTGQGSQRGGVRLSTIDIGQHSRLRVLLESEGDVVGEDAGATRGDEALRVHAASGAETPRASSSEIAIAGDGGGAEADITELQGGLETLTLEELGSLELRMDRLRELVSLLSAFLHEEEVARLEEDLADLASDDLSASQRMDILRRMRHTYAFLTPVRREEPLTSLFGLRLLG